MILKEALITFLSYVRNSRKRKLIKLAALLQGQEGLEIGGPSPFFSLKGGLPVYLFAKTIDGVNFSTETVWEGQIKAGRNYNYYKNKTGIQYIAEAADLSFIDSEKYDFVLSCHSLEHVANPVKALMEWNRVLKPGGTLFLVLPDKDFTFDHKRPITTLQHLINDYKHAMTEDDTTHFDEISALHDLSRDPARIRNEQMDEILKNNSATRLAHHHVFDFDLISKMLSFTGFETVCQQKNPPFHLVTVGKKS